MAFLKISIFASVFIFVTVDLNETNVTLMTTMAENYISNISESFTKNKSELTTTTMMATTALTTNGVIVCRMDESLDFRADPENVYECRSAEKCCLDDGKPSCCIDKNIDQQVIDQVMIWGGIFGVIIVIGLLICCFRRDSNCCEEDDNCWQYFTCACCSHQSKESDEYRKLHRSSSTRLSTVVAKSIQLQPPTSFNENTTRKFEPEVQLSPTNRLSVQDLQAVQAKRLSGLLENDNPLNQA